MNEVAGQDEQREGVNKNRIKREVLETIRKEKSSGLDIA